MRHIRTRILGTTLGLGCLASSGAAFATGIGDECATDADCEDGLVCEVVGGTACACPDGAACEPCETVEIRGCVPGPCETDADCGGDLVCVTYEVPCAMTDVPCRQGEECPAPPPCEATTDSVCAPKWVLPCAADADCGDGFECAEVEMCECSGGGATPPPTDPTDPSGGSGSGSEEGGVPAPPDESDCTCGPTGEKACRPKEVVCEDDAGCAEGWTCARNETDVACVEPAVPDGGSGSGEPACPADPPAEPGPGQCIPMGWSGGAGDGNTDVPRGESFGVPTSAEAVDDQGSTPLDPTGTNGTKAAGAGCGGTETSTSTGLAFFLMAVAFVLGRGRLARR